MIPNSVTNIGKKAFYYCRGFTGSLTIGNGVTSIGEKAFSGCRGFTGPLTIPDSVTSIGSDAFDCCSGLTSVAIPDSVTSIGAEVFRGCSGLTRVTIGNGVTRIGDRAFMDCHCLTSVTFGNGVTSIGNRVFSGCPVLMSMIFKGDAPKYASFSDVHSKCMVYVDRDSSGWGVDIPGVWKGLKIRYQDDYESHVVTFEANGGTSAETTRTVDDGGAIGALPRPTRSGYAFVGWFTETNGGGSQVTEETVVTGDVTYYAHWTAAGGGDTPTPEPEPVPKVWTVTFDAQGGSLGTTRPTIVTNGCVVGELPVAVWDDHTFNGWFTEPDVGSRVSEETIITTNVTFYAHWTEIAAPDPDPDPDPEPVVPQQVWTVTFDAHGGSLGTTRPTIVTNGCVVGELPVAVWDGHTFDGWFAEPDGGSRVSSDTVVTTNVTFYAHWTEIPPSPPTDSGELDVAFAKAQTVDGALYRGDALVGTVQVKVGKINKKGVVKVSATATMLIDGKAKKVTAKAVNVNVREAMGSTDATGRVPPVNVVFKAPIGEMAFEMAADGSFTLKNGSYLMAEATIGGALKGGSHGTFRMDGFDLAVPGELLDDLLPNEESFSVSNGKWAFAKAATVKWAKPKKGAARPEIYDEGSGKGLIVDEAGGKINRSGLKLTYAAKTGQFKGSFKVYSLEGGGSPGTARPTKTKLVKYTVNVIGFVVDGVGYGEASCKKIAGGPWAVTVE